MLDKTLFVIVGALGLAVIGSQAQAKHVFGAKLDHDLQVPSICNPNRASDLCTWVETEAQKNPGHETAPVNGTITQIKLMACGKGSFILQIAHASPRTHRAKVVRTGPLINYVGDVDRNCNDGPGGFFIETFSVNVPVQKGDYLAVVASRVNFVTQSGDSDDVYDPPLADGQPTRKANNTGHGGGLLMLQAVMNP